MSAGVVFIAEFIRAWAARGFAAEARDDVARCCGLEYRRPVQTSSAEAGEIIAPVEKPEAERPGRGRAEPTLHTSPQLEVPLERFDQPAEPAKRAPAQVSRSPRRLEPVATGRVDRTAAVPEWWPELKPMAPSPPARLLTDDIAGSAPQPLLRPGWQRAIFAEIAATSFPEGEPDTRTMVDRVAALQPITEIPRRPVRSIRRGLCCFVDHGDGMRPFSMDQDGVVQGLRMVVGRDALTVRPFRRTPMQRPVDDEESVQPPPRGQPLLVVTDLGIGRPRFSDDPATPAEWLRFAHEARRNSNRVIALVPYPPSRWPRLLRRSMAVLFWDPATSPRTVSAELRRRSRSATV
jgi:hypothetical protein